MKNNNFVHGSYFEGNKISDYGLKEGYVDFRTFCKSFDMVLNNDIMPELENKGFFFEMVNGFNDNSEEIEELYKCIEALEDEKLTEDEEPFVKGFEGYLTPNWEIDERIEALRNEIEDLENEDYSYSEIFQYFIISDYGAKLVQEYTDYPLFYCDNLDMYILGVTHFGTSWDYVLTDIKCNVPYEVENK